MSRSYLLVLWAGGGNVGPFLVLGAQLRARGHRVAAVAPRSLSQRLDRAGIDLVASPEGWLAEADEVLPVIGRHTPDVLVVDYMLTSALWGAEASGLPTVALVHTLYRQLLVDGSPHPIGMAGDVDTINETRNSLGLDPIARHADLLAACAVVAVAAPRELDEIGDVPPNLVYLGPLVEGPGPDDGWSPPVGDGPLVVVSAGTAGEPDAEVDLLERVIAALGSLPARGFVTLPDYIDPSRFDAPPNVTVTGYVAHAAVLPHADLMVTHAGLGSISAALAHGVPMVCLSLGREQPDNARAVERIGAGQALDPAAPVTDIRQAMAAELARSGGVRCEPDPDSAVRVLELVGVPSR